MSEVGPPASRPGATELGPAHVVSPNKSGRLAKKADTDEARIPHQEAARGPAGGRSNCQAAEASITKDGRA